MRLPGRLALALACVAGVGLGVGVYTLHYAEALSYLSTDPAACANCHIMEPQYASWQRASHRNVAGCVDCHLPHEGLAKWIAKADNGYRHSRAFTFQDFHEPIVMTEGNRRTLQANCLACHGSLTHELAAGQPDAVECVHCHRSAGHGERVALGSPARARDSTPNEVLHE
ncbi:MAG: cytochrome c nitrite reductase small subunit [Myxococcota bacterium]